MIVFLNVIPNLVVMTKAFQFIPESTGTTPFSFNTSPDCSTISPVLGFLAGHLLDPCLEFYQIQYGQPCHGQCGGIYAPTFKHLFSPWLFPRETDFPTKIQLDEVKVSKANLLNG